MFLTLFFSIFIVIRIVLFFRFINAPHKPPLFGVYQQKNKFYWIKFTILFIFLSVRQWLWRFKRFYAVEVGKSDDGTIHVHEQDVILEQKFDLGQHPHAVDGSHFSGVSEDGSAIEFALTRQQGNTCDAMATLTLNNEEYLSPQLPNTFLEQEQNEFGKYSVQGIKIEHFLPMRTWKLFYNGEMKVISDPTKAVSVSAALTWSAVVAPFLYDYDSSARAAARDLAREPWTADYWRLLQRLHHTRYDQMGCLSGTVTIDGKEHVIQKMPCLRERTFGLFRSWHNYHRAAQHWLALAGGDTITLSVVSQPFIASHLITGFICRESNSVGDAIESCDFKLYQHGENKVPPTDYAFTFKSRGEYYTVRVVVTERSERYIGSRRDVTWHQCRLAVDVNGVPGRGFARWYYYNQQ